MRALDLVPVEVPLLGLVQRPHRVELSLHGMTAARGVEFDPVGGRRIADDGEVPRLEIVEDRIAYDVAVG